MLHGNHKQYLGGSKRVPKNECVVYMMKLKLYKLSDENDKPTVT